MADLLLTFACGCVERFGPVEHLLPDWLENVNSSNVCLPDCADCASHGRECPARAGDDLLHYRPVEFADVRPAVRRSRKVA